MHTLMIEIPWNTTVVTIQDQAAPSTSQPVASRTASESAEASERRLARVRARRRERLGSETAEEKEMRLAQRSELGTECGVRPAQPARHASNRCETTSGTNSDWRLKHCRRGKLVLPTSDSANSDYWRLKHWRRASFSPQTQPPAANRGKNTAGEGDPSCPAPTPPTPVTGG